MHRRLLAVMAHPDDETFLMGGTLALLADRGWSVLVLTVTTGERGRRGPYVDQGLAPETFGALRREELEAACRSLGVRSVPVSLCPDGEVPACKPRLRKLLAKWMDRIRPHVVVTFGPDGVSGHRDHVAVGRSVRQAIESYAGRGHGARWRPELLYVLGSEALPECCRTSASAPEPPETLRVDISRVADRKLKAMAAYRSQQHLMPKSEAEVNRIREVPERFHRVVRKGHGYAVAHHAGVKAAQG